MLSILVLVLFDGLWLVIEVLGWLLLAQLLRACRADGIDVCWLIEVVPCRLLTVRVEFATTVMVERRLDVVVAPSTLLSLAIVVLLEGQSPPLGMHRAMAGRMVACSEIVRDGMVFEVDDISDIVISAL